MVRVRDIMSTGVVTVSPDLGLRDTLELLAERHLNGVPVVAGRHVVGVVSATDLLEFAAVTPPVPTDRPEVPELEEWEAPEEAAEGSEPPGAFFHELWADVGADVLERFAQTRAPEWDVLAGHTVAEVMSRRVCSVTPGAPAAHAAGRMLDAGVHRLLVLEAGQLVGIVTMTDIVRAVADGRLGGVPSRERGPRLARR